MPDSSIKIPHLTNKLSLQHQFPITCLKIINQAIYHHETDFSNSNCNTNDAFLLIVYFFTFNKGKWKCGTGNPKPG